MKLELMITKFKKGISLLCWNHLPNYSKNPGKTVTPKRLAERMEQKLHRQIPIHTASYIYTSLGFVTRRIDGKGNRYSIIPNHELLAEKQAQYCK